MTLPALVSHCLADRDPLEFAREQARCRESWLLPIDGESPVGEEPTYNDDFQFMREEVNKLSGADPAQVARLAEGLLKGRCKDLRVATYYLWARLQMEGELGLADGLNLLAALLDRFPEQVLPSRPNSRRLALEWLATAKVLDGLSRYPAVVKAEAERTVAALAWLEQGVQRWPVEQRPQLGPLYSALAARLAQSGGVEAVVPQNSAPQVAPGVEPGAMPVAPKSGRDLLDSGRLLAAWLREQPQGWLSAHRLMRSLRWDTLHDVPPHDAQGCTRLSSPRSTLASQLKRLHVQQRWEELLEQAEHAFAEGVNHYWLDLHWYVHQALGKLPEPQRGWATVVAQDLGALLERLPGLEALCWDDGTPLASEATREWIAREVSAHQTLGWLAAPTTVSPSIDGDILALEGEALAQADGKGVDAAMDWLAARPEGRTGRQRWLLRLLMARVAEQYGKTDLALHLLSDLDATGERHALAGWEPELQFEIKARLLKSLRVRSQRGDADRVALARQMETLLAALVAIDPVRAAVLCG